MTALSTDGHRLAESIVPVDANASHNFIIPRKTALEVLKLTTPEESVRIFF